MEPSVGIPSNPKPRSPKNPSPLRVRVRDLESRGGGSRLPGFPAESRSGCPPRAAAEYSSLSCGWQTSMRAASSSASSRGWRSRTRADVDLAMRMS